MEAKKYSDWKTLYDENKELIDAEYQRRFMDELNKILNQIDKFQDEEHKKIDDGAPAVVNDVHRKNIDNLEEIYRPLYNYIMKTSIDRISHGDLEDVRKLKNLIVETICPEDKNRGKRDYWENTMKARKLADIIDRTMIDMFLIGASVSKKEEDKDYYEEIYQRRNSKTTYDKTYGNHSAMFMLALEMSKMIYEEGVRDNLTVDEMLKKAKNMFNK